MLSYQVTDEPVRQKAKENIDVQAVTGDGVPASTDE
jgi:hypothetical protein